MTGKYLTDYEKGQIQGMKDCGIGVTQIARTMKRNIRTIMRLLKKARDLSPGHCPAVKPKTGRPRKVNAHGLLVMKKAFQKSPRKTLKHLKLDHPQLFGDVKVRTLNLACTRDLNMRARVAKKNLYLQLLIREKDLNLLENIVIGKLNNGKKFYGLMSQLLGSIQNPKKKFAGPYTRKDRHLEILMKKNICKLQLNTHPERWYGAVFQGQPAEGHYILSLKVKQLMPKVILKIF